MEGTQKIKCELYNDNFQNFKRYNIPKAQLVIADIPYNLGVNAYGSNPQWYVNGDNSNGESEYAGSTFFNTDGYFKIPEYMHFCSKMLVKEPKKSGKAPAMIVFCAYNQLDMLAEYGAKYGFAHSYPLFFIKNYSPQVLKANMKIVGATETALVLYRDKLPKFNNNGRMIFNCVPFQRDTETPKIHPTQKPVKLLEYLIGLFTDPDDVVIDPCFGSGSTARACLETGRNFYGFEINKEFYRRAKEEMISDAYMVEKRGIPGQTNIFDFLVG